MKSGVYIIKNKINGKVYVGSAVDLNERWTRHKRELNKQKHHSVKLQNAWNKYGADAFEHIVLQYCEKKDLISNEQYWIEFYNPCVNGYNINKKAGSYFGTTQSEEIKIKRSKALKGRISPMKGKKFSKEHRAKISEALKGRIVSEESKKKMSISSMGNVPTNKGTHKFDLNKMYELLNDGLSQQKTAKILGISQASISLILKNK